MNSTVAQYGGNIGESFYDTKARLKNARLKDEFRNSQTGINKFSENATRPIQTFSSDKNLSDSQQISRTNELRRRQRLGEMLNKTDFGIKTPKKARSLLERSYRRIKRHQRPIWTLNFIIAFYLDAINPIISAIPYIGWVLGPTLGFCGGLYINISLWRVGNVKTRSKRRIEKAILSILNMIPYINFIPFVLVAVARSYDSSKESSDKAKKTIQRLQNKYPELITEQA